MITVWRVVRSRYARSAFDGEGARRAGGRFNSRGTPMIYTADSLALAMLEVMVHVPSYRQLHDRVAIPAGFEERHVEVWEVGDLPEDWRATPPSRRTQSLGDAWVREQRSVVLRVPSAVVARAYNYLLNPEHPDFGEMRIGEPEPLVVDPRLVK